MTGMVEFTTLLVNFPSTIFNEVFDEAYITDVAMLAGVPDSAVQLVVIDMEFVQVRWFVTVARVGINWGSERLEY